MKAKLSSRTMVIFVQAFKIALGSSAAIYLATFLNLQFSSSAGIIALLTILTTRMETLKLSLFRILTFFCSVIISWLVFAHLGSPWLAFGVYILFVVAFCEAIGWKATISVNSVVGTHFLTTHDFSPAFILNEFLLILIGISIAILLNFFTETQSLKKRLQHNLEYTQSQMQLILEDLATYLTHECTQRNVWTELTSLEQHIQHFSGQAYEYHGNAMKSHTDYYISYFEMRAKQCGVIHSLHSQMRRIRSMPKQAQIVAEYILYIKDHISEMNHPKEQLHKLELLCKNLEQEALPTTHLEFESRALLYHILLDLEEFLQYKNKFVQHLDEEKIREYWVA